ncbi:MAG: hypothetical protein L3K17_04350 [Thermoplasmata archaeon]|nr:hypothetical protein [Thermoplasmata archaeon]
MSLPTTPRGPEDPLIPSRDARRCSACSGYLQSQGARALQTAQGANTPPGVLVVEMYWCPHCGKIELYSIR